MPIGAPPASTIGIALIPLLSSSAAISLVGVSGFAIATSVVITSRAFIRTDPLFCDLKRLAAGRHPSPTIRDAGGNSERRYRSRGHDICRRLFRRKRHKFRERHTAMPVRLRCFRSP
jgi:hypothetical protein